MNPRSRVLMLTFEYGPLKNGGLATMTTSLCDALDKSRFQPVVVLPRSGVTPPWRKIREIVNPRVRAEVYEADDTEVWLLDNPLLNSDAIYPEPAEYACIKKFDEYGERVAELLPDLEVDLVHLHDAFGYKCLYETRQIGKPTLMTVHRLHRDEPPSAFAEMAAIHLVDAVCTVSASYLEENRAAFAWARRAAHVVPNGVDTRYFGFDAGESVTRGREARRDRLLRRLELDVRPTFGYVGRLDGEQKGIDVLAAAWALGPFDVNLVFMGEGEEAVTEQVRALADADPGRIHFTNRHCAPDEVKQLLGALDFVLIPSRYEPFGLVQLEAMAMGAVPIASRTGGLKDVIVDIEEPGGFGRLVPPGDPAALARAIESMAEMRRRSPEPVDRLRETARARADEYTTHDTARAYEALYDLLLARTSTRGDEVPR